MKRKSWLTTPIIVGLILSLAICLITQIPEAFALTNSKAQDSNVDTATVEDVDIVEPTITSPESVIQKLEENNPTEETTIETIPAITEPANDMTEITNGKSDGCDHFWRREYQPETETEAGYIFDSCLHCDEWYIVENISPIGN